MNAIVDTDALLGLFNINDTHHIKAVELATHIQNKGISIFILPTTLCEFALLASSRIGMKQAQQAIEALISSDYVSVDITEKIVKESTTLYRQQSSKEESLFDCFVMVVTKRLHIDYVFSFDRGYEKRGFTLLGNS